MSEVLSRSLSLPHLSYSTNLYFFFLLSSSYVCDPSSCFSVGSLALPSLSVSAHLPHPDSSACLPTCISAFQLSSLPQCCSGEKVPIDLSEIGSANLDYLSPAAGNYLEVGTGPGNCRSPPHGSGPAPPLQPPWRTAWCRAQDVTTCKGHTHTPKKMDRSTRGIDIGQICNCPSRLSSLSHW